jgi:cell division septum initiation protein DivIVA
MIQYEMISELVKTTPEEKAVKELRTRKTFRFHRDCTLAAFSSQYQTEGKINALQNIGDRYKNGHTNTVENTKQKELETRPYYNKQHITFPFSTNS